jgi:hypothetical protein
MLLPFNSDILFQDFPPVFFELGPFPHFLLLNLNLFELLYILVYLIDKFLALRIYGVISSVAGDYSSSNK